MTRSSRNWRTRPGSFDTLHLHRYPFPSSHPLGFPDLLPQEFVIQDLDGRELLPYHTTERDPERLGNAVCHFFIDDYRFESVWTRPETGLQRVRRFAAALTPTFPCTPTGLRWRNSGTTTGASGRGVTGRSARFR